MARHERESEVMAADFLFGERVVDPQGENIGRVEDLLIDAAGGRVRYAIISCGGIFGLGEKLFALPWQLLQHDPERRLFVLPVSREELKNAPGFDQHSWPSMDRGWERRIHRYYDQTPYWEPLERPALFGGDRERPPRRPQRE